MTDLILHHYSLSPFSEKMRAMLGYAQLSWHSVTVPEMPPRPLLAPLAAGYRKIPVAQIGADIFCDTRMIAREIARLSGKPELDLANCSDEVQAFARRADGEIFLVCLLSAGSLTLLRKLLKDASLLHLGKLLLDRVKMGANARVKATGPRQAKRLLRTHLDELDVRLRGAEFLFDHQPNAGDFAAYHSLWFIREVAEKSLLRDYPRVNAWMDRMAAFGHGEAMAMPAEQALVVAQGASPRELPVSEAAPMLDKPVAVAPSDYGRDPVAGRLVNQQADYWVLGCESQQLGQTQVFLPRDGFELRA